jgi:DNA-binding NtrC family response regulator
MGTVLLVEEDEPLAERVAQLLRAAGHEVSHAPDSLAALKLVDTLDRRFEVLVTPIRMPPHKPHGFALARMARLRRPGLAVIYLATADTPELTSEIPVGPILSKPIEPEALAAAVEDALQQHCDASPV